MVQHTLDRFTIRAALRDGSDPAPFEARVRERFIREFGPATTLRFDYMSEIPRTPGGKYFAALCEIPEDLP